MFTHVKAVGCAAATLLAIAGPVTAETALETALSDGQRLDAAAIADQIVDHTVTARAGERTFLFYYGADNTLTGRMVDGDWSDQGYYGITDGDQVCLSMSNDDGRLRCMTLVRRDGVVQKFDATGKLTFELLSFQPGNAL